MIKTDNQKHQQFTQNKQDNANDPCLTCCSQISCDDGVYGTWKGEKWILKVDVMKCVPLAIRIACFVSWLCMSVNYLFISGCFVMRKRFKPRMPCFDHF